MLGWHFLAEAVTEVSVPDVMFRWSTLMITQGVLLVGMILGYLSTRSKVSGVAEQATKAATLAEPTGNGFAKEVKDSLTEIKVGLVRVEHKIDEHIRDHAQASFKER